MSIKSQLTTARISEMNDAGRWLNRLVIDYLDDFAAHAPESVAIVEHNSESQDITEFAYADIAGRSKSIALNLVELGVKAGDVVAVQLPNWWHYAAVYCACVRIGAVINPLMPIFRERELTFMLGFASAKIMIVPQKFRGFDYPKMIAGIRDDLPELERVIVVNSDDPASDFNEVLLKPSTVNAEEQQMLFRSRRPDPNDVTEIIYTSGTTGQPKGVMHTANTLLCKASLAKELFSFTGADRIFMGSPLAHQTGFMYGNVFSIFNGTACVMQDQWDPVQAAHIIARQKCTVTLASTPFLSDLIHTPEIDAIDFSSLRLFLCAGAPIPRVLVKKARSKRPHLYVMSAWGMTEMGIATATYPGDPDEKVTETDGRALPHQAVRVVNDAGTIANNGEEGRLQSKCVTTFVGYLKRPEEYGVDADGWLETGDNARMDEDGYIRITGRSKDIIIRGGENIPVVEVEELLYRHPAIVDAAIVAMPDERLGERACAFVSLKPEHEFDFESMIQYLDDLQLSKQYFPEKLQVIADFPRTPSGKIQKFVLREQAKTLSPLN
ncbi:MAG: AMP-binding protein [Gammaproteobacteria bacterium]